MRIYCVVLHFGDPNTTLFCLQSLTKLSIPKNVNFRVVVVDNDPSSRFTPDKSIESIKEITTIIRNNTNLGYAGGNNVGISLALEEDCDFVMTLNNDTRVEKNCLVELLKSFEDPKAGIAVPKIYFEKGYEFHKDRYEKNQLGKVIWYAGGMMDWKNLIGLHRGVDEVDIGQFDEKRETKEATGCCMLIKTDILSKIGLLDSKYFLYYEDADFSQRVKKAGYTIIYTPKAVVWHKNAESTSSGSPLQDYYISRNRLLFGMRYAPLRTKIALLREAVRLDFGGREWQKKGIADFFKGKFGKGSFT